MRGRKCKPRLSQLKFQSTGGEEITAIVYNYSHYQGTNNNSKMKISEPFNVSSSKERLSLVASKPH